jgi:hypothetical protein
MRYGNWLIPSTRTGVRYNVRMPAADQVITTSPEAAYATKSNIKFPESQSRADAAAIVAAADVSGRLPAGESFTVAPGSIKPAT